MNLVSTDKNICCLLPLKIFCFQSVLYPLKCYMDFGTSCKPNDWKTSHYALANCNGPFTKKTDISE